MVRPEWADINKLWYYATSKDAISLRKDRKSIQGAGITQPGVMPDIRQDGSFWGGSRGLIRLRDSNDFIDLSTIQNRISRYREYERLQNMAEIDMALTVFADEACISGETKIVTLLHGPVKIKTLTERWQEKKERFLVYCWDFEKQDYTLGWAYDPRLVKTAQTIKVLLDDGSSFVTTEDHRILLRNQTWKFAGLLQKEDELMPFYRLKANELFNRLKTQQFPRVFTHKRGWISERRFIEEWAREADIQDEKFEKTTKAIRLIGNGMLVKDMVNTIGHDRKTIEAWIKKEGFEPPEIRWLYRKQDRRTVVGVQPFGEKEVYDLSVDNHQCFCTDSVVMHNCQKNDNDQVLDIKVKSKAVKEELEELFFSKHRCNYNQTRVHELAYRLFLYGDHFEELLLNPDNPKDGILRTESLSADSLYRIETTKGRLIEFQQSGNGPDYLHLARVEMTTATDAEVMQATALRFSPMQVVHWRVGVHKRHFYPYGTSLIEAARGPAHQLRLMEDAMVVYRLCLVGDSRIRTKNGWKYIKDIQVGDDVYCYDNGKIVPTKVKTFFNNGIKEVFKVKSQHIELTGNATHPVLVLRDDKLQYVEIQNLIPKKDKLINVVNDEEIPVKINRIFGEKWAKLSDDQRFIFRTKKYENISEIIETCDFEFKRIKQFLYSEGKCLPYNIACEVCDKFHLNKDNLIVCNKGEINPERINVPESITEEFAQLFGFLLGDGSVDKTRIRFSAGVDPDLNKKYEGLLSKFFGYVGFDEEKRERITEGLGNYCVSSMVASQIIFSLGYIPGAHNKRIPDWAFTAPKNIRQALVIGLADADACVRHLKTGLWTAEFEMCNKQIIEDVKELWHSIGLSTGSVRYRKIEGGHEIEPGRKMVPTESYAVYISEQPLKQYEKIWTIEPAGEEAVYDFEVENDRHNFVVNGTISANSRAPERRIFYIDIMNLAGARAEAFVKRMQDQFRKKKVPARGSSFGASAVEERWHGPAVDEDYWVPIRPNSNTRIETLPGATQLGETDDVAWFRNKLYTAMHFPRNYFNQEDPGVTRISLSALDVKFARMTERLQAYIEMGFEQIANTHLMLRGFPEELYDDLRIKMTPPSPYKELGNAEIITNRINNAGSLVGAQMMSKYDVYTKFLKYSPEESEEMLARLKIEQIEAMKNQVIASNPQLLGLGQPAPNEQEIGAEAGGPNPQLAPPQEGQPEGMPPEGQQPPQEAPSPEMEQKTVPLLPKPSKEDIKKYDMDITDYESEQDSEDVDQSEEI